MDPQQSVETGNWVALAAYMGFSFFVGFAIGFAVKTFLKIMFFLAGTILLILFVLQYNGMIEVNWAGFETVYDSNNVYYFLRRPRNKPKAAIEADDKLAVAKFFKPPRCGVIHAIMPS